MHFVRTIGLDINLLHWRNTLPEKDIIVCYFCYREKKEETFFFVFQVYYIVYEKKSHILFGYGFTLIQQRIAICLLVSLLQYLPARFPFSI